MWYKKEYKFKEDTCTSDWAFHINEVDGEKVIEKIVIEEPTTGCFGHYKTIMALVRNMKVNEFDIELLKDTPCKRRTSCGQLLSNCIEDIKK